MATDKLRNQMDGFMQPASDQAPTMGLYDTNTPQSVREGTPLRLFDKSRARYKKGDVVEEDQKIIRPSFSNIQPYEKEWCN